MQIFWKVTFCPFFFMQALLARSFGTFLGGLTATFGVTFALGFPLNREFSSRITLSLTHLPLFRAER